MLGRAKQKSPGVGIFSSPNDIINKVMMDIDEYPKNKHEHRSPKYGLVIGDRRVEKFRSSPKS